MVERYKVELALISDNEELLAIAQMPIPLPKGIPEWISPITSILPGQLFAYHLTRHRGFNPDAPRIITKVTETR
jgi:glucosamine--fructose-6-phosphate aminotransferase (isomerizing)